MAWTAVLAKAGWLPHASPLAQHRPQTSQPLPHRPQKATLWPHRTHAGIRTFSGTFLHPRMSRSFDTVPVRQIAFQKPQSCGTLKWGSEKDQSPSAKYSHSRLTQAFQVKPDTCISFHSSLPPSPTPRHQDEPAPKMPSEFGGGGWGFGSHAHDVGLYSALKVSQD